MNEVVIELAAASAGIAAAALRLRRAGADQSWSVVPVQWPRELRAEQLEAVLSTIAGLGRGRVVALEMLSTANGIEHRIAGAPAVVDSVRAALRAQVPAARIGGKATEVPRATRGTAWVLWPRTGALRKLDSAGVATGLLGSGVGLADGESLLIRAVLTPTTRGRIPEPDRMRPRQSGSRRGVGDRLKISALRIKYGDALIEVSYTVAATAGHRKRAAHLLARASAVLRSAGGPAGRLVALPLPGWLLHRRTGARGTDLLASRLSIGEMSGLLAWPIGSPRIAGLRLGSAPLLAPARSIPTRGRRIAQSNWPGEPRDLCQDPAGALSHTLIVGPTGSGKSVLLGNLAAEALAGRGALIVVDGKGDTAGDALEHVADHRADVVVLDLGAGGPVPGLRVFGRSGDAELNADLVLGVLKELFQDSWGPRSEHWLRAGLLTISLDSKATLADLPFVFTDADYRRRLVGRVSDPLLAATWATFEAMSEGERAAQLAAPMNKLGAILGRQRLRAVLGQADPRIDLPRLMQRGGVLIVNLAPGVVGGPTARLLGALVVHEVFKATAARARLPKASRRPCMVLIDEPQTLADLPVPLDVLFEQARGLGVGLTLAAQSLAALPVRLRQAMLTNVGTLVSFRQNADDARLLAREFDAVEPAELQALEQFEVLVRIGLGNGALAPPATGTTYPPSPAISDPAEIRRRSTDRYGAEPDEIDRALFARHENSPDAPVGRTRRQP